MSGAPDKRQQVENKYEELAKLLRLEEVPVVDVETLQRWLQEEGERVVLVDVRSREECEVSTLPGALWQEEFERDRARYEGRRVVSFCTIGARSGTYTKQLRADGVDAFNLRGSVLAWTHRGLPLVCRAAAGPGRAQAPPGAAGAEGGGAGAGAAAEEPTRRVHVYGKDWALAADGYDQVWFSKRGYIAQSAVGLFKLVFGGLR